MKLRPLLLFVAAASVARADLTIVQKVEAGANPGEVTIRIKGDKVRIDPAPQISLITESRTGDTVTLMRDQKKIVRMSGERMKAAAEMVGKFAGNSAATPSAQNPKLTPLGRHEQVNGIPTDLYTVDTVAGKATYYIAPNYPDGPAILQELQAAQPSALAASVATNMPNFRDLPGVPLKIEIDGSSGHMVTTLVSIKRDPIPDAEFAIPADYSEMKVPAIFGGKSGPAAQPATPNPGTGQPPITPIPRPTP